MKQRLLNLAKGIAEAAADAAYQDHFGTLETVRASEKKRERLLKELHDLLDAEFPIIDFQI